MIYVTHDQVEAMTLADRIVVLNAGRVEQVGAPLELYNDPANPFVAGFIGSPQMNFLEAAPLGQPGKTLGIRPEHLDLHPEAGAFPAPSATSSTSAARPTSTSAPTSTAC